MTRRSLIRHAALLTLALTTSGGCIAFYGHRDVTFVDPFGYNWTAVTVKEEMSVEEMHRRMKGMTTGPEGGQLPAESKTAVSPIPRGYRTVTPYLVAQDAETFPQSLRSLSTGDYSPFELVPELLMYFPE